MEAAGP